MVDHDDRRRALDLDEADAARPEPPPETTGGQPETTGRHPDASPPVSLMITNRQRADLRALGFTEDAIRVLTPAEAHRHLGLDRAKG